MLGVADSCVNAQAGVRADVYDRGPRRRKRNTGVIGAWLTAAASVRAARVGHNGSKRTSGDAPSGELGISCGAFRALQIAAQFFSGLEEQRAHDGQASTQRPRHFPVAHLPVVVQHERAAVALRQAIKFFLQLPALLVAQYLRQR